MQFVFIKCEELLWTLLRVNLVAFFFFFFAGGGDNASQLSMQDSDAEKSDDNLVVDVSNEVCLWLI